MLVGTAQAALAKEAIVMRFFIVRCADFWKDCLVDILVDVWMLKREGYCRGHAGFKS